MGKSKGKNNSKKLAEAAVVNNGAVESSRSEFSREVDGTLASDLKKSVDLKVEDDKSGGPLSSDGGLECPICKKTALSRCGGCNKVAYCSREHQRQDWKGHKANCSLWKVAHSSELGHHLIATRAIKFGSVILQEKPLLLVPPRITAPVCLGCYNELLSPEDVHEGIYNSQFSASHSKFYKILFIMKEIMMSAPALATKIVDGQCAATRFVGTSAGTTRLSVKYPLAVGAWALKISVKITPCTKLWESYAL